MTKYELAANLEIAGLHGYEGRLPAKVQRQVFNAVLFGKRQVRINLMDQGAIAERESHFEGTHTSHSWQVRTLEEIAARCTEPNQ